jgi:hypothetical protein
VQEGHQETKIHKNPQTNQSHVFFILKNNILYNVNQKNNPNKIAIIDDNDISKI